MRVIKGRRVCVRCEDHLSPVDEEERDELVACVYGRPTCECPECHALWQLFNLAGAIVTLAGISVVMTSKQTSPIIDEIREQFSESLREARRPNSVNWEGAEDRISSKPDNPSR